MKSITFNSEGRREVPILFSAHMVRALLSGKKTQTRRISKVPPAAKMVGRSLDKNGFCDVFFFDHAGEQIAAKAIARETDILYVRETFRAIPQDAGPDRYEYLATEKVNVIDNWSPSIHMPKAACRILLEILDVRVEHLHDISDSDAEAEGVTPDGPVEAFMSLWKTINGEDSWDANPWVFVYTFKRYKNGN